MYAKSDAKKQDGYEKFSEKISETRPWDPDEIFDHADYPTLTLVQREPTNHRVAMRLAQAGLFVFPCGVDKKPLGGIRWREESSCDEALIVRWWDRWPNALPAIDCGKSGLLVIDCDRHGGPDGVAAFETLIDEHGLLGGYQVVHTPSDGLHFFFCQPSEGKPLGNSKGALPPGIDVRGVGGYVIASGATLPDGRQWSGVDGMDDIDDAFEMDNIPEPPAWLVDTIRAPKMRDDALARERNQQSPQAGGARSSDDAGARAWAAKALDGKASDLAATPQGWRDEALNASSYAMGTIIARGWIGQAEVVAAFEEASRANGFTGEEGAWKVRSKINRAIRDGMANPHPDLPDRDRDEAEALAPWLAQVNQMCDEPNSHGAGHGAAEEGGARSKQAPGGAAKKSEINATPYPWPDCSSIPPRDWLYGRHYIRGFVGVTAAPGGVGKSQLMFAEAASMISGRELLCGVEPTSCLNVWIWNGEDPIEELYRRVGATMKHYQIKREDCNGQLFVDSGRNTKIVIAEATRVGLTIARPVVDAIKARIIEDKIDVMIIDPFVKSHRVSENDNSAIDAIASEWADIANHTGCAIELVHHVRKVGDVEVTVEATRGASALIGAARSARVLNQMTEDDAGKAGVEDRRRYFRVNDGKANMSIASEHAKWFRMESVDLQNRGRYEDGDSIGVVTNWKWPDPLDGITVDDLAKVRNEVSKDRWREDIRATKWAGYAVATALDLDANDKAVKSKISALLKIWIKNKALIVVDGKDDKGMDRKFVECGSDAGPGDEGVFDLDEVFDPNKY